VAELVLAAAHQARVAAERGRVPAVAGLVLAARARAQVRAVVALEAQAQVAQVPAVVVRAA
jgi:hypothetical protein